MWKSTSELGYPSSRRSHEDLRRASTLRRRRGHGDNIASMAWGARNLISTQVRDVLTAGTDVDCGEFVTRHAWKALAEGLIDEALIDARLVNLFKVRMRLGHFDLSFDVEKPRGPST